jgi:hypothetical protein
MMITMTRKRRSLGGMDATEIYKEEAILWNNPPHYITSY